jgi:large subunit ribosomal protein L13
MKRSTISWHKEDVTRKWYLIDASGLVLGRLATRIVSLLRGKGKTRFTPHVDCGDYVVVIHADKIKVTGKKEEEIAYYHYTGYPGGLRKETFQQLRATHPDRILLNAVRRMMPTGPLGRQAMKKLKVYRGAEYQEKAQKPELLALSKEA